MDAFEKWLTKKRPKRASYYGKPTIKEREVADVARFVFKKVRAKYRAFKRGEKI